MNCEFTELNCLLDKVGHYYYGQGHPMKPHRMRMAHNLLMAYGLYQKMEIYRPVLLSEEEMCLFHADDYVHFLRHANPDNIHEYERETIRCRCKIFIFYHLLFSISLNCYIWIILNR